MIYILFTNAEVESIAMVPDEGEVEMLVNPDVFDRLLSKLKLDDVENHGDSYKFDKSKPEHWKLLPTVFRNPQCCVIEYADKEFMDLDLEDEDGFEGLDSEDVSVELDDDEDINGIFDETDEPSKTD